MYFKQMYWQNCLFAVHIAEQIHVLAWLRPDVSVKRKRRSRHSENHRQKVAALTTHKSHYAHQLQA